MQAGVPALPPTSRAQHNSVCNLAKGSQSGAQISLWGSYVPRLDCLPVVAAPASGSAAPPAALRLSASSSGLASLRGCLALGLRVGPVAALPVSACTADGPDQAVVRTRAKISVPFKAAWPWAQAAS